MRFVGFSSAFLSLLVAGVIFADGPAAREQRQFMTRHLKDFGAHGQSMETRILAEIDSVLSHLDSQSGQPQNMSNFYYRNVINSLLNILLSKQFESGDPVMAEFAEIIFK